MKAFLSKGKYKGKGHRISNDPTGDRNSANPSTTGQNQAPNLGAAAKSNNANNRVLPKNKVFCFCCGDTDSGSRRDGIFYIRETGTYPIEKDLEPDENGVTAFNPEGPMTHRTSIGSYQEEEVELEPPIYYTNITTPELVRRSRRIYTTEEKERHTRIIVGLILTGLILTFCFVVFKIVGIVMTNVYER